jgi:hypothetical protein
MYHMYVTGNQGMFTYGDTGPNKYTATANGIMFYGQQLGSSPFRLFSLCSPFLPCSSFSRSQTYLLPHSPADMPVYTLFQRDRGDAPDPMSLLYYDPQVTGNFWDGLPLDRHFANVTDGWFSGRSSWTDNDGCVLLSFFPLPHR